MKILIVTHFGEIAGGVETYLRALIPGLTSRGHEVAIGWEVDPTGIRESFNENRTATSLGRLSEAAFSKVESFNPEVVYCHGLRNRAIEEKLTARYPAVLFAHDFSATCISGTKRWKYPSVTPCHRTLSPICLAEYFPRGCGGLNPMTAATLYKTAKSAQKNLSLYRRVLVASHFMAEDYKRHTRSPVHILPVPMTIDSPAPKAKAPPSETAEILFLSRLTDLKGGADLIEALSRAKKKTNLALRLHVAGAGPELESLKGLAAKHSLQTVFHGWVDGSKRSLLFEQAHLLAMPSLWPEPFGLSGVEAGAFGVPSIAYRTGGIEDWLVPGLNGELAEYGRNREESLARSILNVVQDPKRYEKYSAGAREKSLSFGMSGHLDGLLRHLSEAASS